VNKILVVAAHPDDEILGVGGTVRKLADQGKDVYAFILGEGLTSREDSRTEEGIKATDGLKSNVLKSAEAIGYKAVNFGDLPDNRFDSCDLLDVIKIVEKEIERIQPDTIFTHHYSDLNIDHVVTVKAVMTATRPMEGCCVRRLLSFETLSSTEWNFNNTENFKPNYFIDISAQLGAKLEAMKAYETEIREFPHPRSLRAIEVAATKWGTVVGCEYAEAFEVLRIVD